MSLRCIELYGKHLILRKENGKNIIYNPNVA